MGTYQSKYTGAEIDEKLDQVGQVASAEMLGGIKIGEGLEITEDGVLSALGGGSSSAVHIETVIWEGHSHTGDVASSALCENTLTLSQPITNFDKIGVYFNAYDNSVKSVRRLYKEVPTSRIIEVINDTSLDYSSVSIAWGWGSRESGIDIKVGSTVNALSVYSITADAVKIVGIK